MKKLIGIVIPLLFFVSLSYADSFSDIRTQVRRHVKDTGSTLQRFSDDYIDDLLNEGQKDVVNRTWCIVDVGTITLTAATTYYDLRGDMIAMSHAYYTDTSSNNTTLDEVMERSLRQSTPDFDEDSGAPLEYFIRQSTSGVNDLEMGIRPVPSSITSESITYHYYAQASDMSADADVPFEGLSHLISYHPILGYYAVARLYLIEGKLDRATGYNTLYETGVSIMRERIGMAPNYSPSFKTNTR